MASLAVRSGGALRRRIHLSHVDAAAATAALRYRQVRALASLAGATTPTTRSSSSLLHEPRVDMMIPVLPSPNSPSLRDEAQVGSGTPVMLRAAISISDVVSGSSITLRKAPTETHLRPVHSIRGIKHTTTPVHPQTYGRAATGFRRHMSSVFSPSAGSPVKKIPPGPVGQDPQLCDDGKAEIRTSPASQVPQVSYPDKAEVCKYNEQAVFSQLHNITDKVDKVDAKVDGVSAQVKDLRKFVQKTVEECNNLAKDVAVLKKKEAGSGDWTSFRIKGKTLNWLSVGSAAWDLFKGFFK